MEHGKARAATVLDEIDRRSLAAESIQIDMSSLNIADLGPIESQPFQCSLV